MPIRAADLLDCDCYDSYPRGVDFPIDTRRIYDVISADIICLTEEMVKYCGILDYHMLHPDGSNYIVVTYWRSSGMVVGHCGEFGIPFYNARCLYSSGEEVNVSYREPIIPIKIAGNDILICGAPYFTDCADRYRVEDSSQILYTCNMDDEFDWSELVDDSE